MLQSMVRHSYTFSSIATMLLLSSLLAGSSLCFAQSKPIRPNSGGRSLRFSEHLILDGYTYAYGIAAADLDGDGDLDLTSADALPNNNLYWHENDGTGHFRRHFIQKDDPQRLERHAIGDVNGDGFQDVVIVKNLRGDLLWFENHGRPANGRLWRRHVITTKMPGAYDVALADLDNDGDLDVAASFWRLGNQFAWFENDGSPDRGEWTKHIIEDNIAETRTIRAADFDADGDIDLLGTARNANLVVWYENGGPPADGKWTRHIIDATSPKPVHGEPADMDGDGDLDVVMALGFPKRGQPPPQQIVWYENAGQPKPGPWKKHVIADGFDHAFEAVAADMDADGDMDVVGTGWGKPGMVAWFENHGSSTGRWTKHVLKTGWKNANQPLVADLDGDGDLDIAAVAERGANELRWWKNEGAGPKR